jgi:putative nucleotidyltransferase with HDIG domain
MGAVSQGLLTNILQNVKEFPSMPGAAARIMGLLDDPDSTAQQLEEVLRMDPGLTANILKLANSAYFGLPREVGSIRQAIVLLGWRRVGQMVMAHCVQSVLHVAIPGYELAAGELWRHSIAVSVISEGLVRELGLPRTDEIFTAALLHDLGKVVLGEYVSRFEEEVEIQASEGLAFEAVEQQIFGVDHAEVGARILESWSFPSGIVGAVRWHHEPEKAEEETLLLDVVHVANVLSLMVGFGLGRGGLQHRPSVVVTRRLGLTIPGLEGIASRALDWVRELQEIFGARGPG